MREEKGEGERLAELVILSFFQLKVRKTVKRVSRRQTGKGEEVNSQFLLVRLLMRVKGL